MNKSKTEKPVYEIEIHYKRPIFDITRKINRSQDIENIIRKYMNPQQMDYNETFITLFVSNANQLLHISSIACGTVRGACVDVKQIVQLALKTHASAIIIAHNHPSGTLKASFADIQLTKKVKNALDYFGITLLDHIIITSESYLSFADDHITPF